MYRKTRALMVLFGAVSLSSCVTPSTQIEKVAKDWALMIRGNQMIPVYPLSEDLQPGDLFLVETSLQDQAKEYEANGFLALDQHLTRLTGINYGHFYNGAYGVTDTTNAPQQWQFPDRGPNAKPSRCVKRGTSPLIDDTQATNSARPHEQSFAANLPTQGITAAVGMLPASNSPVLGGLQGLATPANIGSLSSNPTNIGALATPANAGVLAHIGEGLLSPTPAPVPTSALAQIQAPAMPTAQLPTAPAQALGIPPLQAPSAMPIQGLGLPSLPIPAMGAPAQPSGLPTLQAPVTPTAPTLPQGQDTFPTQMLASAPTQPLSPNPSQMNLPPQAATPSTIQPQPAMSVAAQSPATASPTISQSSVPLHLDFLNGSAPSNPMARTIPPMTPNAPPPERPIEYEDTDWCLAPQVAFPTFNFKIDKSIGAQVALPIQGVPVALSYMQTDTASGTIAIGDAHTYGVSLDEIRESVWHWAGLHRSMLASLSANAGHQIYLRVVNRIYITGQVTMSMTNANSSNAGVDLGTTAPNATPAAAPAGGGSPVASIIGSATASLSNSVTNAMPKGSVHIIQGSSRGVSMVETFPRPLVIGYIAFDFPVAANGDIGDPISTKANLKKNHPKRVFEKSRTDYKLMRAAVGGQPVNLQLKVFDEAAQSVGGPFLALYNANKAKDIKSGPAEAFDKAKNTYLLQAIPVDEHLAILADALKTAWDKEEKYGN